MHFIDLDDTLVRRSTISDGSERMDQHIGSTTNNENDLNESVSSRSNPGDTAESLVSDGIHLAGNIPSLVGSSNLHTTNSSRTSVSTQVGHSSSRPFTSRLTPITERRRSPDALMKKWMRSQKLTSGDSNEPIPLSVSKTDYEFTSLKFASFDFIQGASNPFVTRRR